MNNFAPKPLQMKLKSLFIIFLINISVAHSQYPSAIDTTLIGMKEVVTYWYKRDNPEEIQTGSKLTLSEKGEKLEQYQLDTESGEFYLSRAYKYENGQLVSEDRYRSNGTRLSYSNTFEYNDKGLLVRSKTERPYRITEYVYDDKDRVSMVIDKEMNGADTIIHKYNDEENSSETCHMKNGDEVCDGRKVYYDENQKMIRTVQRRRKPCSHYYTYEANREVHIDSCSMVRTERTLNDAGKVIHYTFKKFDGSITNEHWHNEQGDWTKIVNTRNGEVEKIELYEYVYDSNNNILEMTVYHMKDGNKVLFQKINKTYDEKGNWLTSEFYNYLDGNKNLVRKEKREIVYY